MGNSFGRKRGKDGTLTEEDYKEFCTDALKAHNEYRSKHPGTPEVCLNRDLCKLAQDWAEHLKKVGELQHKDDEGRKFKEGKLGEALAYKRVETTNMETLIAVDYKGAEMTEEWYKEVEDPGYDFKNPGFNSGTGQFTQIIWKSTQEVGFGIAKSIKDENTAHVYVVGFYYPAGNIMSTELFKENVLPKE